ncbi:MAG: hypothetical protein LBQ23_03930 [Puniceicoccales bacterium]|nr:hypothetical protein [Puniceicoccales bacterium]
MTSRKLLGLRWYFSCFRRSNKRKADMKITTSDSKEFDNFEKVQDVVKKIQGTKIMKKVAGGEGNNQVTYGIHKIQADDRATLETHIQNVLNDISGCFLKNEIYSKGNSVPHQFTECLNFLLTWLRSIHAQAEGHTTVQVDVATSQMREVVEWAELMMKKHRSKYSEDDFVCVEGMIKKLRR